MDAEDIRKRFLQLDLEEVQVYYVRFIDRDKLNQQYSIQGVGERFNKNESWVNRRLTSIRDLFRTKIEDKEIVDIFREMSPDFPEEWPPTEVIEGELVDEEEEAEEVDEEIEEDKEGEEDTDQETVGWQELTPPVEGRSLSEWFAENRRNITITASGILFLLIAALVINLLFFRDDEPPAVAAVTDTPEPTPDIDATRTAQVFSFMLTETAGAPTPDETATAEQIITEFIASATAAAPTRTTAPTYTPTIAPTVSNTSTPSTTPTPTETPLPTNTPTITPTPTPSFPLPFIDDFSDGLDPQWNTTEGTVAISDGWLNGAGDNVSLLIGDDTLSRYVVEFDFSIPHNYTNYLIWGDELTYDFNYLTTWWLSDSGTIKQDEGVGESGTLQVIVDGNHYQVFLNGVPFDDVIFGNPYSGPLMITLYYSTSISNFSITPLD